MSDSAWPREYLGRLFVATVLATVGVFVAVWVMITIAGGSDSVQAVVLAPVLALGGTFLVGTYQVLTGPDDTPPLPFALILGGFFGVFAWAVSAFVLR